MSTQNALAGLQQLDMKYRKVPMDALHSAGVADALTNRLHTMKQSVPIAVRRFQDRARGPVGYHGPENKLARDLYHKPDFESLPPEAQQHVQDILRKIHDPASSHPYLKKGFTFAQARHVLMDMYKLLSESSSYPQEIRTKIADLADAMEKDIAEAAKKYGFYPEYAQQLKAVKQSILATRSTSIPVPSDKYPGVPR